MYKTIILRPSGKCVSRLVFIDEFTNNMERNGIIVGELTNLRKTSMGADLVLNDKLERERLLTKFNFFSFIHSIEYYRGKDSNDFDRENEYIKINLLINMIGDDNFNKLRMKINLTN